MNKDFKKVKCRLVGTDGNIFALIATSMKALRQAGFREEADELNQRITVNGEAKNYDEALGIILEYVDEGEDEQPSQPTEFKKVKCNLFGEAINYVSVILTIACNALNRAGFEDKAKELSKRVRNGRSFIDYESARQIILEYIEEEY